MGWEAGMRRAWVGLGINLSLPLLLLQVRRTGLPTTAPPRGACKTWASRPTTSCG